MKTIREVMNEEGHNFPRMMQMFNIIHLIKEIVSVTKSRAGVLTTIYKNSSEVLLKKCTQPISPV